MKMLSGIGSIYVCNYRNAWSKCIVDACSSNFKSGCSSNPPHKVRVPTIKKLISIQDLTIY